MGIDKSLGDLVRFAGKLGSNVLEGCREIGVLGLVSQLLGPEGGQEEVGTAVVVLAHLAGWGLALVQQALGGLVQGGGQHAGLLVAVGLVLVAEGLGQRQELTEGVPAQVVFFLHLLDVLRGGAAGTGLEEAAARHQRNHGQHLCGGTQLEDGEEVRVVVTQHVTGHGDGVLAAADALDGGLGSGDRILDLDVQVLGVVVLEVLFHQGLDIAVVAALWVEPEDGLHAGQAGAVDGELDPVLDRLVLGLAGTPDIAGLDVVLDEHLALGVADLNGAVRGNLEGLVVGAVLLGLLGHQADVWHGTHGGGVEGAVFLAVLDDGLVHAGVGRVRDNGQGVLLLVVLIPHVAGGADHCRHGGVNDDIGRHVQVGDALVGVDHGEIGAIGKRGFEGSLDLLAIVELV